MAGTLRISNYIQSLQTITDVEDVFPSTQRTLTYYVGSPGGTQGWTATIQWMTLVIDQYTESSDGTPNFNTSRVFGYYPGGTANQVSTGTISIPGGMYTGPLLPASLVNVPITVVNVSWIKDGQTYEVNLALKQNWEPGVTIQDPYGGIGFEPISPTTSTLQLSGPEYVIAGDTATFTVISDIPIDLGYPNPCYFYANNTLVATENMIDHTAIFNIATPSILSTGTYTVYAIFGGIRDYGTVQSNTQTLRVVQGVPLIRDTDSLSPNKTRYFAGEAVNYSLRVIPDPAYPASGYAVTTTSRVNLVRQAAPNTATTFYNDRFYNGNLTATITISTDMVDSSLASTLTQYQIQSYTTNTTVLTATILISNTNSVVTSWDYQLQGYYLAGTVSRAITVSETATRTLVINDFPIVISQSTSRAIVFSPIDITVLTTSSGYSNVINIWAHEQSSATRVNLYSQNHSLSSQFTASVQLSSTGTWSIYATYAGDFGQTITWANRSSTSNQVTHIATLGNDLPLTFEYRRVANQDLLIVTANTTTTVTNAVSYYNPMATYLGSATWVRQVITTSSSTVVSAAREVWAAPPGIINWIPTEFSGRHLTFLGSPGDLRSSLSTQTVYGLNGSINYTFTGSFNQPYALSVAAYDTIWERGSVSGLKTWFNYFGYRYAGLYNPVYLPITQIGDQYTLRGDSARSGQYYDQYRLSVQPIYENSANSQLQNKRQNQIGRVNPNAYRAWRYFDGSNYQNLSSSTAFLDHLDPINTGTWQVNLIQTHNFGQRNIPYSNSNISFADNSRIYNDSVNDYGFDQYDIYRFDTFGQGGYNVVGLNAVQTATVIACSTSSPVRLYFKPEIYYNPRATSQLSGGYTYGDRYFYIDLIRFLGTITQTNPIRTPSEALTGVSTSTSTIHLYEFTPTVRLSDEASKAVMPYTEQLNQLPANTLQASGRASRIAMTKQGIFKMPLDAPVWPGQYVASDLFNTPIGSTDEREYGRLRWNSRNTALASENEYTDFCNAWYSSFCLPLRLSSENANYYKYWAYNVSDFTQRGKIYQAEVSTTTTVSSATNIQTATLYLSTTTLNFNQDFIAIWPGTVELGPEYGDYNGQTLTISYTNTIAFSVVPAGTIGPFPGSSLRAQLNNNLQGRIEFYNFSTDQIYATATVTNQVALAPIVSTQLTSSTGTSTVNITTRFIESPSGRYIQGSTTPVTVYLPPAQVIQLSPAYSYDIRNPGPFRVGDFGERWSGYGDYFSAGQFAVLTSTGQFQLEFSGPVSRIELSYFVYFFQRASSGGPYFTNETEVPIYTWLNVSGNTIDFNSGLINNRWQLPTLNGGLVRIVQVIPKIRLYGYQLSTAYLKNDNLTINGP